MSKDLANWRGPFYLNRKDPRLIVPKYDPTMGWTLNFASPYAYLGFLLIVLIIIASEYFFL
ncbi:hypothetical protein ELS83_07525 [Marinifilum sp. JC070]|uniref:DUF5808 domain-containing protein n=2 Tax=Marinifilum caeruleilacunae TaxID=2499076 RepID=A0ABX1WU81_9BACT|nr:hypothetical protein [Marinifilum caeruleilacunae]